MSNLVRDGVASKNARATARRDLIDSAATPGKFLCYNAPIPATGAAITTQTLLADAVLSQPCGTVADGALTFAAITADASANASGDIAFVRVVNGDGVFVCDLDASLTSGTGAVKFNILTTIAGAAVSFGTSVFTEA